MKTQQRPIYKIAEEISANWKNPYYGAIPYLQEAMPHLDKITDMYHNDDARGIIIYFLANAQTWRGDVARRIKAELNSMLKS